MTIRAAHQQLLGISNNFMINTTGGEARFRFEFFRSGTYTGANTGIPVVLQNVKITSIDP